jgi:hypothetical protein
MPRQRSSVKVVAYVNPESAALRSPQDTGAATPDSLAATDRRLPVGYELVPNQVQLAKAAGGGSVAEALELTLLIACEEPAQRSRLVSTGPAARTPAESPKAADTRRRARR